MKLTLADIDAMPASEYKEKLNDPAFFAAANELMNGPAAAAAVPADVPAGEIDPSMPVRQPAVVPQVRSVRDRTEAPVVAEPAAVAVAPVSVAPQVIPDPLPEQTYSWQPLDEHDRPMGGLQVIKYRTEEEKFQKVIQQNNLILRQLRKVSREARLGIKQDENIPTDAARFDGIIDFKEKPLTAEERFQLTQDMNDPEKFASARDRLLESAIGVPPAQLRATLNQQQMEILQLRAKENFVSFVQESSDFYADTENTQTLTDWMFKNKLAPTVDNFKLASSTLRSAGLLNEAPVVQQVPVPPVTPPASSAAPVEPEVKAQPPVGTDSRIATVEPVQTKRHSQVPSGLNDRVSSSNGRSPADGNSLTLADIDKMSGDEYKKAAKNPAFLATVNRLEKEAALRRAQRSGQV